MIVFRKYILFCAAAILLIAMPVSAQFGGGKQIEDSRVLFATDAVHAGETFNAALSIRLKKGLHVNSHEPLEDYLIPTNLAFEPAEGISVREIVYPGAKLVQAGGLPDPLAVYDETFLIGIGVALSDDVAPGRHVVTGTMRYQACDDKACFAPKNLPVELAFDVVPGDTALSPRHEDLFATIAFSGEHAAAPATEDFVAEEPISVAAEEGDVMAQLAEFKVLQTGGGYLKEDAFLAFIDAAESGEAQRGGFEGLGPITIIFLTVVGGIGLNLTPCVLPLIPINLAIIGAGAQAGSRIRGFMLGGTYGLAMAAVYGVLGLIVILTAGTFGAINALPWFSVSMAVLFVVLALGMFDVIPIDFSKFQSKLNLGQRGKGTFALAFGMGAIAALLAGACVAPVVIQVIVFSSDLYNKGTTIALALPFLLGVGMALPWPFAGAGLSFLPKPGAWMVRVKQAFGVFIFGFAAYYGYLAYEQFAQRAASQTEVASTTEQTEIAESAEALLEEGWVPSLSQGLTMAKAQNKKVLVDMWATWCKNCLVMDKTTLKEPEVVARLEDYVKVKFQAEDLSASPAKEVLEHFNGIGLPTYAILEPISGTD